MGSSRLPRFALTLGLSLSLTLGACSSLPFVNREQKQREAGPQRSESAYYTSAQRFLKNGRFEDAARDLEALETYYPTSPLTEQSQLDLMYARFQASDYPGAASTAERFTRLYRQNPQVDYAYYVRGIANVEGVQDSLLRYTRLNQAARDISPLRTAYQNFDELVRLYPNSRFRNDAVQRMRDISAQLAESEMVAARFNLKRSAWLGAAARAKWVLENYPQSPQTPEAVATLAYAYDRLGMTDLANTYREVLRLNYPALINGDLIDLAQAQGIPSWTNRLTLGIAGRPARGYLPAPVTADEAATAGATGNTTATGNVLRIGRFAPNTVSEAQAAAAAAAPVSALTSLALPASVTTPAPVPPGATAVEPVSQSATPINPLADPTRVNPVAITPSAPMISP